MAKPWKTIETVETKDGLLELRQHGESEFLITIAGRILMNSRQNRSELALAELGCHALAGRASPLVLIGGLGMGCTLRAALGVLPEDAHVIVCELNDTIERWCRGPLEAVNGAALADSRVEIVLEDVATFITNRARNRALPRLDAILLDLYEGPNPGKSQRRDPIYGGLALDRTRLALAQGGIFAVWSETPDAQFEKRLTSVGFRLERRRPGGSGGLRHAVYLAHSKGAAANASINPRTTGR